MADKIDTELFWTKAVDEFNHLDRLERHLSNQKKDTRIKLKGKQTVAINQGFGIAVKKSPKDKDWMCTMQSLPMFMKGMKTLPSDWEIMK